MNPMPKTPESTIIKDGTIITQDANRRIFRGDVLIIGNKIEAVGESISEPAEHKIDAKGDFVLPGLINIHTHAPMSILRGYGDDMTLETWLNNRIWPAEAKFNSEIIRAGTDLALLEMIASGTTAFNDMYFFEDEIAEQTEKAGLRGFLAEAIIDLGSAEKAKEKLAKCESFVKKWKGNELIEPVISPHGAYTCTPETLVKSAELSEKYRLLLHTHCSETRSEVYDVQKRFGARPVEHLEKCGIIGPKTTLAHCGWITKAEVKTISKAGATLAHCPVSNMKLATGGYAPLPEMFDAGGNVGLGTDGAASNNTLDMFETMKFCALLFKHHRWDPTILPAQKVLDLATIGGAKAMRRPDLGSIEPGKTADIIIVDGKRPNLVPAYHPVSNLVYAAKGADVKTTICNGKILMENREFKTLNFEKVLEKARKTAEIFAKIS
ncbi:MAG: amidohydrolase [Candidatus Thermoplasmatota archaeon]|nr:amidohydrolase [Candidatus Thermoplasmatota archaeon]